MNILIVDDSSTMRKILKKTLNSIGYTDIQEASNGKEALELIKADSSINCIFLDINMPIMSGKELIVELKKEKIDDRVDIVLISTEVATMSSEELKRLGVIGSIAKPFKANELKNILSPIVDEVKAKKIVAQEEVNDKVENIVEKKVNEKIEENNISSEEVKEEKFDTTDIENESEIEEVEKIEVILKKSVQECIEEYVSIYTKEIEESEKSIKNKKQLDYKRMKRFMMTAYNNLVDIDPSLRLSSLEDAKDNLLKVEKIYEGFTKKMGFHKRVAYEEIFLQLQEDYMHYFNIAEKLRASIEITSKKVKNLNEKLQLQRKHLSELRKNTTAYEEALIEFKSDNKKYADFMHNLSILKDELHKLNSGLRTFRDEYYEEFVGKFQNVYVDYDKKLLNVLNVKCHELDSIMWEKAKHSRPVRNFFEKSRITGGFSTQTFLEYYLKSIDKDKISEENSKLFELLEYLKIINNKTITIIHSDMDEMLKMKSIIEKITTGYRVHGYTTPLKLLDRSMKKQDLVILDYEMRTLNVNDFFKKYKKIYKVKDNEIGFLLIFSTPKKDILMEAIEFGVLNMKYKNFLIKPEHLSQRKLEDKINLLL